MRQPASKHAAKTVHLYIDGSYHPEEGGGYGWVAFSSDRHHILETESEPVYNPNLQNSTSAELVASLRAAKWAEQQGFTHINIHHDYSGVETHALNDLESVETLHSIYRDYFRYRVGKHFRRAPVKVYFHKIASHSGVIRNEMADFLAKGGRRKHLRRGWLAVIKRQWGSLLWSAPLREYLFPKSKQHA